MTERRVCSVLFCDLVGFTPLSEARDPEEVRELLSRYFETARTVIGRYGGTVEKFIGDAVMAVWGTPTVTEGDAERAVRAALDLTEEVAELGREIGTADLAARAGVVTGEVAVTIGAVGQGMVAGDAVNTAARVQAAAEPGHVLLDDTTWRLVRDTVACAAAGEFTLKGKSQPVALWRAQRVVSGTGGGQRIDGLEAPLLGRDAELRLVKELFHACADRRSARLVSIVGPAGVGKSRLGWEFFKYIDGLVSTVYWHRGRCLSYGDGVAFFALAEMVRQRLGIAEEDSTEVAAGKLDSGLERYITDGTVRDYVRPRLARLLGVDSGRGAALGREELFAGWRTFFEQLAAMLPVALVVEDLHHADAGLLDFIEHLLDWARDAPIFVLTLARPEIEERRPGWGTGRRNATALSLEALDDAAMHAMIDSLVSGMPATARVAVAAQAQGIPLYAVETVRMLIDRDVVQPIDGAYRLTGEIGELAVPESLQSLLAARLDALPEQARRLVSDAAVIGTTFPVDALVAVSGLDETEVRRLLAELVRREVLAVRADPLSPDRGQYAFVQTMFRQVAYDTLSRRERKLRHVTAADHLASTFADGGEEISEVIAQHLLDALHAAPDAPDAAQLRQRAVETLVRAARRAERTGAPIVGATSYQRAAHLLLAAGGDDDRLAAAGLLEMAGHAATRAGDFRAAHDGFTQAALLYGDLGEQRSSARALSQQGNALRRLGRTEDAAHLLEQALETLQRDPDGDTVAALTHLASAKHADPAALQHLDQAFVLAQELVLDLDRYVDLFMAQGIVFAHQDRWIQAAAAYREALRIATEVQDPTAVGRGRFNLSDALLVLGDYAGSTELAQEAVAVLRRSGSSTYGFALGNLIQAMILAGRWNEVSALVTSSLSDSVLVADPYFGWISCVFLTLRGDTGPIDELMPAVRRNVGSDDPQDRSVAFTADAWLAWADGDFASALRLARESMAERARMGFASELSRWAWPVAADAALALGDMAVVHEVLDQVLSLPPGKASAVARAEAQRVGARALAAAEDPGAAAAFEASTAALRAVGSPWHLARGLADHADYCASLGDRVVAQTLADEARMLATTLGAKPLLARLDANFAAMAR
ncbi:MAG TPA: adenylate/guanylate cyclase domain-containing protein [Mycobacteriales bacterium]|nr:adenylate/guanylate cyclase domain-containing protein [Mycobacteriales bacterium]